MRETTQPIIREMKKGIAMLEIMEMLSDKIKAIHHKQEKGMATDQDIIEADRYADMSKLAYDNFMDVISKITATKKEDDKPERHLFAVNKINEVNKQYFGI